MVRWGHRRSPPTSRHRSSRRGARALCRHSAVYPRPSRTTVTALRFSSSPVVLTNESCPNPAGDRRVPRWSCRPRRGLQALLLSPSWWRAQQQRSLTRCQHTLGPRPASGKGLWEVWSNETHADVASWKISRRCQRVPSAPQPVPRAWRLASGEQGGERAVRRARAAPRSERGLLPAPEITLHGGISCPPELPATQRLRRSEVFGKPLKRRSCEAPRCRGQLPEQHVAALSSITSCACAEHPVQAHRPGSPSPAPPSPSQGQPRLESGRWWLRVRRSGRMVLGPVKPEPRSDRTHVSQKLSPQGTEPPLPQGAGDPGVCSRRSGRLSPPAVSDGNPGSRAAVTGKPRGERGRRPTATTGEGRQDARVASRAEGTRGQALAPAPAEPPAVLEEEEEEEAGLPLAREQKGTGGQTPWGQEEAAPACAGAPGAAGRAARVGLCAVGVTAERGAGRSEPLLTRAGKSCF